MRTTQMGRGIMVGLVLLLAACGGSTGGEQSREESAAASLAAQSTSAAATAAASAAAASASPSAAAAASASADASTATSASAAPATSETAAAGGAPFDPSRVQLGVEQVAQGFAQPLFVTAAADGSLFVVEKGGRLKVLPAGDPGAEPQVFLDIGARVKASGSEQGLLGLALHPNFAENGFLYVNYIDAGGDTVIARFTRPSGAAAADPDSELVLIRQEQPAANHNGGSLMFGPDGYLYAGLGDGGGANDQFGNGQKRDTLLGKLLRIDVDGGEPYGIPADNPFATGGEGSPEVWAYGLRNPWRFSFDRATGDLYIGDVGQNQYEMIHFLAAGSPGGTNFGWPILEGTHCFRGDTCDRNGLTVAVADYSHQFGCSVTGGYVYRGAAFPELQGAYVFGDYCSGQMWTLARDAAGAWQLTEALASGLQISSFGEDAAGEIYLTDLSGGGLYRVTATAR